MSSPFDSTSSALDKASVSQVINTAAQDEHSDQLRPPIPPNPSSPCPVLKLPSESLGEIFMHCMTDEGIAPDTAPLLLLRICSQWRKVAIRTPRLWTDLDFSDWSSDSNPCPMIQLWLENSRSLCIDLNLGSMNGYVAPESYQQEKMRIIVLNIHRIRYLSCRISEHFFSELRDQVLPILAPSLEELRFFPVGFSTPPAILDLTECIRAPRLALLSLAAQPRISDLFTDTPSLRTVRFIFNNNETLQRYRLLERTCNQLQTLTLGLHADDFAFNPAISFPALRELYIESTVGPSTTALISSITAPNIEDFCINMGLRGGSMAGAPVGPLWEAVDACLAGDHPIQQLSILDVPIDPEQFVAMLSRFSHLSSLELSYVTVQDQVLRELMRQESITGRPMICPHLSTLHFPDSRLNGDLLVQLVRARTFFLWNTVAEDTEDFSCLSDLRLRGCDGIESSHLDELFEIEDKCNELLKIT